MFEEQARKRYAATVGRPTEIGGKLATDKPDPDSGKKSRDLAAAAVGVSGRIVQDAEHVKNHAPEAFEEVKPGRVAPAEQGVPPKSLPFPHKLCRGVKLLRRAGRYASTPAPAGGQAKQTRQPRQLRDVPGANRKQRVSNRRPIPSRNSQRFAPKCADSLPQAYTLDCIAREHGFVAPLDSPASGKLPGYAVEHVALFTIQPGRCPWRFILRRRAWRAVRFRPAGWKWHGGFLS
jgi:hypothetical protein